MQNLPSGVQTISETWNSIHTSEFPNIGSWVCKDGAYWMCYVHYIILILQKKKIKNINLLETHSLFFFRREMHLPMIPFHQRATSVQSRQLILEHWVVSPCLLPLLLNTFFCHWFASLVTSLCKYLSNSNVYSLLLILNGQMLLLAAPRSWIPHRLYALCCHSSWRVVQRV